MKQAAFFLVIPIALVSALWCWPGFNPAADVTLEAAIGAWLADQADPHAEKVAARQKARIAFMHRYEEVLNAMIAGEMTLREASTHMLELGRSDYPWYERYLPLVETADKPLQRVALNIYRHVVVNLQIGALSERQVLLLPQWERELAEMSVVAQQ